MPRRPKRPCSYPGCPNLTDGRYCPEHQQKVNSNYEKYGRDKSTKKRYGRAWKRIRDKYAAEHPFCELCFERGIIVPTEEIHHKLPLSEGGTHDRSNLIALCKSCHSTIHAKRGDYWGQRAPAKPASWEEDEQRSDRDSVLARRRGIRNLRGRG